MLLVYTKSQVFKFNLYKILMVVRIVPTLKTFLKKGYI